MPFIHGLFGDYMLQIWLSFTFLLISTYPISALPVQGTVGSDANSDNISNPIGLQVFWYVCTAGTVIISLLYSIHHYGRDSFYMLGMGVSVLGYFFTASDASFATPTLAW